MSVLAGGTNALVQLLARRRVEQQQDMLQALKVADTQKQWKSEQERIRQVDEQLAQTRDNQKLLRLEADRRQAEVERLHEQQLAQNIRENALPEEDMDPRAADLLKKYYLDNGIVQRTPGMSMDMQRTPQAPTAEGDIPLLPQANRGVLKVTPDKVSSLGGTKWQAARQANEEKVEAAKQAEREKDERLKDTLDARAIAQRNHDQMMALVKGMSQKEKPDYEELAELVRQNPAALDQMTPTIKSNVIARLGSDFDYRKPIGEAATAKLGKLDSAQKLTERTIALLKRPEVQAEMGPVTGRIKRMIPGSFAEQVSRKFDLMRQISGLIIEEGVLREADENKYRQLLVDLSNNPQTALSQMNELMTIFRDNETYLRQAEDAQGRRGTKFVPQGPAAGAGAPALSPEEVKRRASEYLK